MISCVLATMYGGGGGEGALGWEYNMYGWESLPENLDIMTLAS